MIPLVDVRAQYAPILAELKDRLAEVVDSGRFILGPNVQAFEREAAHELGLAHAVGVANGPGERLVPAERPADDRTQAHDAEVVDQPPLDLDHVVDGDVGEGCAVRTPRAGVDGVGAGRPAAAAEDVGADHEVAEPLLVPCASAGYLGKLTRDLVIMRLGLEPLGDSPLCVVGRTSDQSVGHGRLGNASGTIENERRADLRLVHQQLGLQQLELEAYRPQILAQKEVGVLERKLVSGALGLWTGRDVTRGFGVDFRSRKNALWRYCICHPGWGLSRARPQPQESTLQPPAAAHPSRSAGFHTSPRRAPRRAAASRSAGRTPPG